MRGLAMLSLIVAGISLVVGIISRLWMIPVPIAPNGIEAEVFLKFTMTCLLASIAFSLLKKG